ncbi:outer membrane protein assembly factor BamD [Acidisphaera sp. S103]|uniref:outer membrane protein assembly factor BamD n=1 Tax=Acidisphaera sp. S103 TaxID=1747223 RepID=UPI0020B17350|nr:outer membrane protein assembly factor BamD [Acidisphaera sp. S103]
MHSTPPRRFPRGLFLGMTLLLPLLSGCGSSSDKPKTTETTTGPVDEIYNNGVDALNARRFTTADDQFNAVEQNYPYSSWAVNAQLMSGYSAYLQNKYTDAIGILDRFIQLHPVHRDIAYAYYLRALCYYEQIADIERDQKGTEQAMNALREVVTRFPDSAYARDAKLKIDLCVDHLAGKEMEVGRFYQKQHLYEAAIGRYQRVVDDFQTTNHVPEALARLTEIYLALGLKDQARKTAAVLGYNYPGSDWYSDSYRQLVADGVAHNNGQTPDDQPPSRGFFSRAWHAVF